MLQLFTNPFLEAITLMIMTYVLYRNRATLARLRQRVNEANANKPRYIPLVANYQAAVAAEKAAMVQRQSATPAPLQAASSSYAGEWSNVAPRAAYEDEDSLHAAQTFMQQMQQANDWMQALVNAFHVVIVGGTRGGKTVLAHALAERRAARGDAVYVIDPDGRPGMYPSAKVTAGYGDDFDEAGRLLTWFETVIKERREARRTGQRKFEPITLVISELGAVMAGCAKARDMFEEIVRRGAKLNVLLVADVQDSQVKSLKLEGASALLINLTRVEIVLDLNGNRTATIEGKSYPVPRLTDPEALADAAFERRQVSMVSSPLSSGTSVPVRGEGAKNAGTEASYQYRTSTVPPDDAEARLDHDIKLLHSVGISWNKIGEQLQLKGQKQQRNNRIRQALGQAPATDDAEPQYVDAA